MYDHIEEMIVHEFKIAKYLHVPGATSENRYYSNCQAVMSILLQEIYIQIKQHW